MEVHSSLCAHTFFVRTALRRVLEPPVNPMPLLLHRASQMQTLRKHVRDGGLSHCWGHSLALLHQCIHKQHPCPTRALVRKRVGGKSVQDDL